MCIAKSTSQRLYGPGIEDLAHSINLILFTEQTVTSESYLTRILDTQGSCCEQMKEPSSGSIDYVGSPELDQLPYRPRGSRYDPDESSNGLCDQKLLVKVEYFHSGAAAKSDIFVDRALL